MKQLLLCSIVWGIAASASAQTPAPITSYEVQVFIAATSTTVTRAVPLTAVSCNLAPLPAPASPPINPTTIQFDDVAIVGRACRASVGTFFATLPPASGYNATMTALSTAGPSPLSNLSNPFNVTVVAVPPFAPTGVGVRP